jgi:hypothetical protein
MSTGSSGSSISRKGGVLKVTGPARDAADHPVEHVAHNIVTGAACRGTGAGDIGDLASSD